MKITFHGAARTVTGSKHLLKLESGENVLLDCGMFQGLGKDTLSMNQHFGFDPMEVDLVILSHAHIDHSGLLPRLYKEGFRGPIYCTPATLDLCEIMLPDSAHIQEQDIAYVNKRKRREGKKAIEPLYDLEDTLNTLKLFRPIPYEETASLTENIKVRFSDNGHILGSAGVSVEYLENEEWKKLFFSGDIGRYGTSLLKDPHTFAQAETIICESTYGDRKHDSFENAGQAIMEAVVDTVGRKKGKLIIPAFSLGRTQEVVYTLNKLDLHGLIPDVKIFVDSPLSVSATEIMRKHKDLLDADTQRFMQSRPDPFGFEDMHYIRDVKDSKKLNDLSGPFIVISASGMAEAGRVKHHIRNNIEDPKNTILIVGYAEPSSLAGKLRNGETKVKIFGEEHEVKCDVRVIDGLSAHGDYEEMLKYLSCQDPSKVKNFFLVHGEIESMEPWRERLNNAGFKNIMIPHLHESFKL